MSDPFALIISERARQDLEDIWDYIALDDIDAANQTLDTIYETCETIAEVPHIGRSRDELLPGVRSFPIKKHTIFYRIHNQIIEIVRILHARQDIESQLY